MHVIFFSHENQIPWMGWVAEELSRRHGCECTLWTLGHRAAERGRGINGFDRVVDLLPPSDRLDPGPEEFQADIGWLRLVEERWGRPFFYEDAAQDRYFQARASIENDPSVVPAVWGRKRVAAFLATMGRAMDSRLESGAIDGLYCESNSAPYRLARRLARLNRVPAGLMMGTRLWPERVYFEPGLSAVWENCRSEYENLKRTSWPQGLRDLAQKRLHEIRSTGEQPPYHQIDQIGPQGILSRLGLRRITKHLGDWLRSSEDSWRANPRSLPPNVLSPLGRFRRFVRVQQSDRYYREQVVQPDLQLDDPYIVYFLHVQPELTVESMAFNYQDQAATIRNFSAALPADVTLLVKEHLPMAGRRPKHFYAELAHLPGIKLVRETTHPHDLIRGATAVLTLTGTVALEAIMLGVPALVVGEVFFNQFEGIYYPRDWANVRALLGAPEALEGSSEEGALRMLAAMYRASVPGVHPPEPAQQPTLSRATVDALYEVLRSSKRTCTTRKPSKVYRGEH